jgi:O-antigen ligase
VSTGEYNIHLNGGSIILLRFGRSDRDVRRSNISMRRVSVSSLSYQGVRAPEGFAAAPKMAIHSSDRIEYATSWLFIAGLAWVPFWYGSNVLFAWGINALLFPGLAVLYEISLLVRGRSHAVGIRYIAFPAALFAAVVLWVLVQTASWVPTQLMHPIWGMAADALGEPVGGSISVNRDLTNLALLRLVTAASVFWLALQLCRDAGRANRFVAAIAGIGVGYAIYGLLASRTGPLPWFAVKTEAGKVYSTFVNRDSYATYAGLGLVAIGGLLQQLYQEQLAGAAGSLRHQLAVFIETIGQRGAILLAGSFLILVALLLTVSRGGVIATGLGLVVLAALGSRRGRHHRAMSIAPLVFGFLVIATIVLGFGDMLLGSIEQRGVSDPNRVAVYLITLRSILDKPLLGFGYGTFIDVFPMYRDNSISVVGIWGQAHNTYLELFQGLGLVFGSMLIGAVVLLALRCAKGATRRRRNIMVPCVASGAACLVGVHTLVDFSLQMQAVALTFAAMLGVGVAQSESSRLPLDD